MRIKAAFIFILTAILYGATLAFSSYVGVYLTYVAIPVLLVSGYIMLFAHGKERKAERPPSLMTESIRAVTGLMEDATNAMEEWGGELEMMNRTNELKRQRTERERATERRLRLKRAEWDAHVRYSASAEEKVVAQKELRIVDAEISSIKSAIAVIEKQCEIEVLKERSQKITDG